MSGTAGAELLYLSRDDVRRCGLTPYEIQHAVQAAFRAKADGQGGTAPPLSMEANGGYYDAKGGFLPGYAAIKWYGYFPGNAAQGLPDFWPMILLNEAEGGRPVAVIDGTWVSEVRTAAITAVAAVHLATPDARRVAFIACGAQARSHLDALAAAFPVAQVDAYSRRRETAEKFAAAAQRLGFEAIVHDDPRAALAEADIVVSSVPHKTLTDGFLDASWLKPGAFASMVDLGYSWRRASLVRVERLVTDDLRQKPPGRGFNTDRTIHVDIADLILAGKGHGTATSALIFAGSGLADVAVAALIAERAKALKIGRRLPL